MNELEKLAKEISKIAARAQNEEDLKIGIEPLLRQYSKFYTDIEIFLEYELQTGLKGRRDAVYGHLTIEYKRPGELSSEAGILRAAEQLASYLKEAAGIDKKALRRVAGVALDGKNIFFLRYWPAEITQSRPLGFSGHIRLLGKENQRDGGFQILGPYRISTESLSEFFRYLNALHRMPLSPEPLAKEFGPGSETAQSVVGSLYKNFYDTDSIMVETLFNQWKYTFGIVYGNESREVEKDVPQLAKGYGLKKGAVLKPSLFAVHTYFALIMKLLAAEILSLQQGSFAASLIHNFSGMNSQELKEQMTALENGGIYALYGVQNFLEGDFFRWYLNIWDRDLADSIRTLAKNLSHFEPATPILQPLEARDLLKKLYQFLVPKKLRHDLGEYYTPDWIAERLLNQLGYKGEPDTRILDPSCGSGTFLTIAITRARHYMEENYLDRDPQKRKECAQKILRNIVGFDLNPLAVIAARTNYLLALGDLLREVRPIEIPVYMCDSILTPTLHNKDLEQGKQLNLMKEKYIDYYYLPTSVGDFYLPKVVLDKNALDRVTLILENCIKDKYDSIEFIDRIKREIDLGSSNRNTILLQDLYDKVLKLDREGKNGVWARLLKNSFAPVLQPQFDLIAGNPPWVNWESLPEGWRDLSKKLWDYYGLFSLKGHEARLGGGKKDLAMLFTYVCTDNYLKNGDQLGFVITQTLFKTSGSGDGFRRFRLGDRLPLRVKHIDDMVDLNPFEGATNRTAIMVLIKNQETKYPVPYTLWHKTKKGRIPEDKPLIEVVKEWSQRKNFYAQPVDLNRRTSPWITARPQSFTIMKKTIGPSQYRAYEGANSGGLNGGYWIEVLDKRPDDLLIVRNLHDIGRKDVPQIHCVLEPDLIYPLLRGRDIKRWLFSPIYSILLIPRSRKKNRLVRR